MKRSLLVTLCIAVVVNPATVTGTPDETPISIYFVDCAGNQDKSSAPNVSVVDWNGHVVIDRAWRRSEATLVRQLELRLPPGFFMVGVRNGSCSTDLRVTVISGHPRALVAVGTTSTLFRLEDPTAMLSGTLPSAGWRVAIVYPDRKTIPGLGSTSDGGLEVEATVDKDAYYATSLPEGKIVVRLYSQRRNSWYDFSAGEIDISPGKRGTALIKNVTEAELGAAIEHSSNH